MPKLNERLPKYRRHRRSGQAVVTINGRDHYLGPHGSNTSITEYDRLIAEWLAAGRQAVVQTPPPAQELSVNALILAYFEYVEKYYLHRDGRPTSEVDNIRQSLRPLRQLCGRTPAVAFGPRSLAAVREHMIKLGWCRRNINKQVHRIGAMFRWAGSQEMLPVTIYSQLKTLPAV